MRTHHCTHFNFLYVFLTSIKSASFLTDDSSIIFPFLIFLADDSAHPLKTNFIINKKKLIEIEIPPSDSHSMLRAVNGYNQATIMQQMLRMRYRLWLWCGGAMRWAEIVMRCWFESCQPHGMNLMFHLIIFPLNSVEPYQRVGFLSVYDTMKSKQRVLRRALWNIFNSCGLESSSGGFSTRVILLKNRNHKWIQ